VDYITKPFSPVIVKLRVESQMRIANQMKAIAQLSMMDYMIEVPNRKYFDRRLHEEWERAYRNGESVGLMIVDIDNFKAYNETYGYEQGNAALIAVVEIIKKCLNRPGDLVARWGGNHFAILMPEAYETGAVRIAERIRKAIEDTAILNAAGEETQITVSIGVSVKNPASVESPDKFISHSDTALHQAKVKGRNRVEVK
jgi:diguanylate cyclase (GGDEF)-like protein